MRLEIGSENCIAAEREGPLVAVLCAHTHAITIGNIPREWSVPASIEAEPRNAANS